MKKEENRKRRRLRDERGAELGAEGRTRRSSEKGNELSKRSRWIGRSRRRWGRRKRRRGRRR